MDTQPALSISGLTKSYGRVPALRGVDLEVGRGEIFGFLGPNGAGKTTTIRCLLDLIRPDGGAARVLGLDPQADAVAVRRRVGYLPGELSIEPNLTAERALRDLADLRGGVEWATVRAVAGRLQLDLRTAVKNMSKGNKQKVGVVAALMGRPELLLLDEPTSGLDPLMQQEVYRLLREARAAGATVFFSSHIISEVEAIAERVAIIRDGRIAETLAPHDLVSRSVRRVRVRFGEPVSTVGLAVLRGVTQLEAHGNGDAPGTATVPGTATAITLQIEGEMDALVKALAAYPVVDLETERPSLEEIFLTLYQEG
ncbi:MAG: ABC transporter ATP-binding protein [Candidatus Promineofilum sp.]|nr:ABC transporter ATP-binding protein [Promineifilum sp.]MCW5865063.1 ABC transporter ATP-binding protein [Anaerolineae bacterium]